MDTGSTPQFVDSPSKGKLSVFVSYARDDLDFADQLVAALGAFGFSTTIDRKGIHAAENWKRRLGQLILESDAVVFVLTAASVESPVCRWEVDEALRLQKRIIPVLAKPLGDAEPYEPLRDLNYIYFYPEPSFPGSGFGAGVAFLTAALSVDVEWTREHTRLGTLASRWKDGRSTDLLLRGSELVRAKQWRDTRPTNAPELTTLQREFLQASEDAEQTRINIERVQLEERQRALEEAEEAERERRLALEQLSRRTRLGIAALCILILILGIAARFAYTQRNALTLQRQRTEDATEELEKQKEATQKATGALATEKQQTEKATAELRKQRGETEKAARALAVEQRRTEKATAELETQKRETQTAVVELERQKKQANEAAAELAVQKREAQEATAQLEGASLRLREGIKLKIAKTAHPVTATEKWYRIATDYKLAIGTYRGTAFGPEESDMGTGFLVKGGSLRPEWADRVVFLTASHVIRGAGSRNAEDRSRDSAVFPGIGESARVKFSEVLFESRTLDVAVLALAGEPPRHAAPVDLASQIQSNDEVSGIAVLHWTQRDGFALGLGHRIPAPSDSRLTGADRLFYTHVTGGGASGAPVFDANSGNVVCLHLGGNPNHPQPFGYCTPMDKIVAAIARR